MMTVERRTSVKKYLSIFFDKKWQLTLGHVLKSHQELLASKQNAIELKICIKLSSLDLLL